MTCFLFFCNSSASQDKEPEGYACVSGGPLKTPVLSEVLSSLVPLRLKRSESVPPDTQAYLSGSLSYEV